MDMARSAFSKKRKKNDSLGFFLYLRRKLNSLFRDCETLSG